MNGSNLKIGHIAYNGHRSIYCPMPPPHRYFVLHKPYGMESQFISPHPGPLLGDLPFPFPEGTHAVGRLDKPSEGLLLLTTDKRITRLLFQSAVPHPRTYHVQVKGTVTEESLERLRTGVSIRIRGDTWYTTPPCEVDIVGPSSFPSPLAYSYPVESTWLCLTISQGKFRQVRKMVAVVRHPCMRLVRTSIEDMQLSDLPAGEVQEVSKADFFAKLKLRNYKAPILT